MSISDACELIGRLGELVTEDAAPSRLWPAILRELQQTIGFDLGHIGASWGGPSEHRGALVGHDSRVMKDNLGRFLEQLTVDEIATYSVRARSYDDVWCAARRRELAVFNEVLDPIGVRHGIVRASTRNGNVAGVNLERTGFARGFSDRDMTLVDVATPFLHVAEVLALRESVNQFATQYGLSQREAQYADLAARGLQNREIGAVCGVSLYTVRNTLARAFSKVGVSNRTELAFLRTAAAQPGSTGADPALEPARELFLRAGALSSTPRTRGDEAKPGESRIIYAPSKATRQ
jgi:DNA-binding CsgD family transcriptional regulator